jgi:mannose-6-phosphate isomerase-like protein (cupin superfamily)
VAAAEPLAGRVLGGTDFVVVEWTDSGGDPRPLAPLHVHHRDDEAWYVLEGKLGFRLGDEQVEASAGSAVLVPRGRPHTFWNPAPETARYLLIMTPTIYRLIEAVHEPGERDMAELFRSYDSELVG